MHPHFCVPAFGKVLGSEAQLSLPNCVTVGELLTSAEPQFPHLQKRVT